MMPTTTNETPAEWLARQFRAARALGWTADAADALWQLAHGWRLAHT